MANLAGKFKLSYEVMGSDFIQFSNKLKLDLLVYGQVLSSSVTRSSWSY